MTAGASASVTILLEGRERCVLAIKELRGGDLILQMRLRNLVTREFGVAINRKSTEKYHGKSVTESRYTIHPSDESADICSINIHNNEKTPENRIQRLVTTAAKVPNSFAPLYAFRYSNLYDESFSYDKKCKTAISLGKVDPQLTLVMMVLVSHSDRIFSAAPQAKISFTQHRFKRFNLTFLWSFLTIPNYQASAASRFEPTDGKTLPGVQELFAFDLFRARATLLKGELLKVMSEDVTMEKYVSRHRQATFLKMGVISAIDYQNWYSIMSKGGSVQDF